MQGTQKECPIVEVVLSAGYIMLACYSSLFRVMVLVVPLQAIVYPISFTWIEQDSSFWGHFTVNKCEWPLFHEKCKALEGAPTPLFGKYAKCTTMGTIIIRESPLRHSGGVLDTKHILKTPNKLCTSWRSLLSWSSLTELSLVDKPSSAVLQGRTKSGVTV